MERKITSEFFEELDEIFRNAGILEGSNVIGKKFVFKYETGYTVCYLSGIINNYYIAGKNIFLRYNTKERIKAIAYFDYEKQWRVIFSSSSSASFSGYLEIF